MGRIRRLDDHLINRIAAGEVVERPASVLKELVENSLDAGATTVSLTLHNGGKKSIRCEDNGTGMVREDALLALERHATSKLREPDDLDRIATFGFRGEALPSIAAVSHFTLRTAPADGEGTEVEISGGEQIGVRDVAMPRGTTILVERLFYNVPARRKFQKADATELSHAMRNVTRFALANPAVRFRLASKNKVLLETPPARDLAERIGQIYGTEFPGKLLPFSADGPGRRMHGFAGRPAEAIPRRDLQHVFVNGRAVSDRVLMHAIRQAYGNTMPRDRHPAMFLFLELDPSLVDVNVHPQKTEVRFRDGGEIHRGVSALIGEALSQTGAVPSLSELRPGALPPELATAPPAPSSATADEHRERTAASLGAFFERGGTAGPAWTAPAGPPTTLAEPEMLRSGSARVIGQYLDSYIVAQDEKGLLLVDQHAAHERVLFERLLAEAAENRVEVQRLAFPVTVELTREEALLIGDEFDELQRLGFLVEPFGPTTVRLDGIPAMAAALEPEQLLRGLLGEAAQTRHAATDVAKLRRTMVTNAACQAAIKINHRLTAPGMQQLIDDLYALRSPTTCPHGRPLIFRLDRNQIERAFDR